MSGFASALTGGGKSTQAIPKWLESAGKNIYGKASSFYDKGFTPYKGNRVAGFNPTQTAAFGEINDPSNYATGDQKEAMDWTKSVRSNIPTLENVGSIVDGYMNPYIGRVVDPAVKEIERSSDAARGRIGDSAFGAHAFGDARHGLRENELDRTTETAIGDTTGRLYSEGYDKALATSMGAAQLGLQGAGQLGAQASAKDKSFMDRILAQLGAGNLQQQNQQSKLDTRYQGYQAKQQDPYDRLAALMSVIQGVPYTKTTQTQSNPLTALAQIFGGMFGAKG